MINYLFQLPSGILRNKQMAKVQIETIHKTYNYNQPSPRIFNKSTNFRQFFCIFCRLRLSGFMPIPNNFNL